MRPAYVARRTKWAAGDTASCETENRSERQSLFSLYLKPELLITDDMGMKQLPKRSGEYLFEIVLRRHEVKSTTMTINCPQEDWGKLLGDVPSATAILDRFLHHSEILQITRKSYRKGQQERGSDDITEESAMELKGFELQLSLALRLIQDRLDSQATSAAGNAPADDVAHTVTQNRSPDRRVLRRRRSRLLRLGSNRETPRERYMYRRILHPWTPGVYTWDAQKVCTIYLFVQQWVAFSDPYCRFISALDQQKGADGREQSFNVTVKGLDSPSLFDWLIHR